MKKIKRLLPILMFALSFGACTDSNDDSDSIASNIEGVWSIEKIIDKGILQTLDTCDLMETLSFINTNKAISINYSGPNCEDVIEITIDYVIDGSILRIISNETGIQEFTILELTSSKLVLLNTNFDLMNKEIHFTK